MTTLQQAITAPFIRVKAHSVARGRADNRRFVIILGALALMGAMLLLAINAWNTAGAFEIKSLQKRSAELQVQQQQTGERVSKAQSPARLARAAAVLGMVPAKDPVFIVVKGETAAGDVAAASDGDSVDTASGRRSPR